MSDTSNTVNDGAYSRNALGAIGTDGVLRDTQGNVVPQGLDEDTKAELQSLIDGPKVRVLPSEHDILKAAAGDFTGIGQGEKYVYPNKSEDDAAIAYKPGYDVTDAESTGQPDSVVAEPSVAPAPSEVKAAEDKAASDEEARNAPAPEEDSSEEGQ